jgi:hypothetical protein
MKVEYLLKLFNHFNKQIWTNKIFSYFLIAIIIGYTIALRQHPDIYYKYIYNPLVLIILIFSIMLIAKYNTPLGFMLTFSLLALYFPKHSLSEGFEVEGFETVKTPIYGEDKNIVDDEKKSKNNKTSKTSEPTKKNQNEKKDDEEEEEVKDEVDEEDDVKEKSKKKTSDKDVDEDEVKDIGLEKLNPGYYKNKNETKTKNKNSDKKTETDTIPKKKEQNSLPKSKESETFLGDVRQVIKDLDTGRGGMNASNAIKSINNLFYNKHKTNIKKIIEEDDEESEDDDDEDFF